MAIRIRYLEEPPASAGERARGEVLAEAVARGVLADAVVTFVVGGPAAQKDFEASRGTLRVNQSAGGASTMTGRFDAPACRQVALTRTT